MPAPKFTKPPVKSTLMKQCKIKLGPVQFAVAGAAGFVLAILAIFLFLGGLSFITMMLFGVLNAVVAGAIPAFGFWASFWITLSWAYAASFFRRS